MCSLDIGERSRNLEIVYAIFKVADIISILILPGVYFVILAISNPKCLFLFFTYPILGGLYWISQAFLSLLFGCFSDVMEISAKVSCIRREQTIQKSTNISTEHKVEEKCLQNKSKTIEISSYKQSGWSCSYCGYLNSSAVKSCANCGRDKK